MKKREQNSILIGFILSIVIFMISSFFLINYVYNEIQTIEQKKVLLNEEFSKYNKIIKKGFDYDNFKIANKKYSNTEDSDLKELLEGIFYTAIYPHISKDLYEKSIYFTVDNEGNKKYFTFIKFPEKQNFSEFLDKVSSYLKSEKLSDQFVDKKEKLKKVLPTYTSVLDNKGLTDLSFINYIEGLLNKYDLKTTSQIGIPKIEQLEDSILDKNPSIYYIPLSLDISGTKVSVLKFLQYIKNSGSIIFKDDNFTFSDKVGATSQLSEVSSMKLDDYIDGSYKERTNFDKDLISYLYKTNQYEDIIDIQLDLKFYVNTISSKKIFEKINNIIGSLNKKIINSEKTNVSENNNIKYELLHYNYYNLLKVAQSLRSNPILNKNTYYKQKAENILLYLNNQNLKKEILAIKKEMKTTKNIDQLYKKVLKYKDIFLKLDGEMYKIAKDLDIVENKIDEKTNKILQKGVYTKDYIFENK